METIIDELQIYRGKDIKIKDGLVIHQPTLGEICEYGEKKYFNMVNTFTSVSADLKWQLDEIGIDYTKISDFELFSRILIKKMPNDITKIIFGNIDFLDFELGVKKETKDLVLYNIKSKMIIDEFTYLLIVEIIRKMHQLKRNNEIAGNETTKRILIEDAKDEYEKNKNKEYHSQLINLISTMINCEGFKYNHDTVWDMKIYPFMDSVERIKKIKSADILLRSGQYTCYGVDLSKIDENKINWLGEL